MYSAPPVRAMLNVGVRDLLSKVMNVRPRSSFAGQLYQMVYRALQALFIRTHLLDAKIGKTVAMGTVLNHPRSRGSVKLASADPRDAPIIDLNLLGAPEDMARMVQAAKEHLKCWQSQPIASKIASLDSKTKALIGNSEEEKCVNKCELAYFCRSDG